jgi:MYXO-CTERM domain-containing protein
MSSKLGRWALALMAIGAATTAATEARANAIGFCDFSDQGQLQGIQLNGHATLVNNIINVTPNETNRTGSAYLKTPLTLGPSTSFQTHFQFRMYPNGSNAAGGAGLAFVLQNKGANTVAGGAFGLTGVSPSVAVEFDTANDNNGDPNANHVGIFVDGRAHQHLATATVPFNMKNGTVTNAWIDYDGGTRTLRIYMSQGAPKPATALLTHALNLHTASGAAANQNRTYVGFSAWTTSLANTQDIRYWVLSNDGTPLSSCVPCTTDTQCEVTPSTPACLGGFCAECSATNSTRCTGTTPVCDVNTGRCAECNTSAECSGNRPVCEDHVCVPCASDFGSAPPPLCPTAPLPACQATGLLSGACTECSATNETRCSGTKPKCITSVGICGCNSDADCGGANSGFICEGSPPVCVPGCRPGGGGNDCAPPDNCAVVGGNVGQCVSGCIDDTTCADPVPHCDTSGGDGVCVVCLDDTHCDGAEVCSPQGTCGDCIPGDPVKGDDLCDVDGAGGICRPGGQCGCNNDTDCGTIDSGRVCDDDTKVCRSGCRGISGNRCPNPDICTSTTAAIGQCIPDPGDLDGGVADGGVADGGTTLPDAGRGDSGSDGGSAIDEFSIEGGGCACSTLGTGNPALPFGAFGATAAAFIALLRRRRRS